MTQFAEGFYPQYAAEGGSLVAAHLEECWRQIGQTGTIQEWHTGIRAVEFQSFITIPLSGHSSTQCNALIALWLAW